MANLRRVKAKYDFRPQDFNEIRFSKGDEILVLDDSDANWWRGRTTREDKFYVGIFPKNYVE